MEEKELFKLKTKVGEAKENTLKLEGEQGGYLKQLEKDWNCKTVEEANKKLKAEEKEQKKTDEKIKNGLEDLTEKLKKNKDG